MAGLGEAAGSIASAVTAVVADRAASKFLDSFNRQAAADEKLQRLERLLVMIRSTVQVSEEFAIESAALLQWQEKLRDAASHGDEVLLSFQQRATDAGEAAAHQNGNDQQAGSSSTTTPGTNTTALSYTRNALSSMARRICSAATALFASDEEKEKLYGAVEALEKASENIGEFIGLLRLEASLNRKRRVVRQTESGDVLPSLGRKSRRIRMASFWGYRSLAGTADDQELQKPRAPAQRLQEALAKISMAVHIVEARDIQGLEWLAQWADVLREAMKQGHIVLTTISAKAGNETVEYDLEDDELRSFVHTIESLAGDLECFNRLTSLCEAKQISFPL